MSTKVAVERARRYLAHVQDADGGWGYRAHQAAFVEPTALGVLALAGSEHADALRAGQSWLAHTQHPDGSWGVSPADEEGSWATAWAIWSLADTSAAPAEALARGVAWWRAWQPWVGEPGQERDPALWIDPSLAGWPWSFQGASWVEPTALGIIALVAAGGREDPRVREGLRYLLDRTCATGGWNVGNPYMLGQNLPPLIPPTALALLALREAGVPPADAVVRAALETLDALVQQAHTPLNLAWGLWAMRCYAPHGSEKLAARLCDQQAPDDSWRHSPYLTALAILALAKAEGAT